MLYIFQSILQSHEKVENEVRAYSSEIDRLKELSRKVIEVTPAAFVSWLMSHSIKFLWLIALKVALKLHSHNVILCIPTTIPWVHRPPAVKSIELFV